MSIWHCFEVWSVLEELAMKIPVQSRSRKMDVQNSPVFILSTVTTSTTPLTPPPGRLPMARTDFSCCASQNLLCRWPHMALAAAGQRRGRPVLAVYREMSSSVLTSPSQHHLYDLQFAKGQ